MIMVRRRARPAKEPALLVVSSNGTSAASDVPFNGIPLNAATSASAASSNNLLEDQYFASPKRKDCRLMKIDENLKQGCNNKDAERSIGVPLATRSQTRTIENFFKANAAAKTAKQLTTTLTLQPTDTTTTEATTPTTTTEAATTIAEQKTITINVELDDEEALLYAAHSLASLSNNNSNYSNSNSSIAYQNDELQHISGNSSSSSSEACCSSSTQTDFNIETELELETVANNFQTHRSTLRDSHSSSHSSSSAATSDNIFLQEPVLTLDIDRTPTKASSIRINRSFELASAVFSSPPSVLSACLLNGRFNQIVTLNGHSYAQGQEQERQKEKERELPLSAACELDQHDSSSCDSGVACSLTLGTSPALTGTRRRKPATPHRILCPSPIKTMPRCDAAALLKNETQSPRKSPRKLQMQLAASNACKSRRRLNQPKPQAPYQQQQQQQQQQLQLQLQQPCPMANEDVVVVLDDDDDDIDDIIDDEDEDDVQQLLKAAEERENMNKAATKAMPKPTAVASSAGAGAAAVKPKASTKSTKTKSMAAKSQPLAATNGNRELTEFFPVRRSVRKTKTVVKEEMMRNLEQAVLEERCEGLQVRHFMGKGRGVVAIRRFKRNEFVIEYVGDLIAMGEATDRERCYALDENAGCYMYYFKHKNQQYCIDATIDTGKLGRLINHSRNGNLMTKVVVIKQRPHLVLLAKDDIEAGEELTYDYGDRSKESLLHHPWLAF